MNDTGSGQPLEGSAGEVSESADAAAVEADEPLDDSLTVPTADPLRRSRTGGFWVAVAGLAAVMALLVIFVAQNTDRVGVQFLGWDWHAPLAVVILTGAVAGMVLVLVAGTLRIWQLRRRVKRSF
jgi:uncharacterized integral membrane protein